jgi:hypothetical protein
MSIYSRPTPPGLWPRLPLPGPRGKPGDWDSLLPIHICLARTLCHFFGVYRFCPPGETQAKDTPRGMGPKPKNFKPIFGRGVSRR